MSRVRRLSTLLDNAVRIPGTDYRVGIDPILGLIPGGGDIVGGLLSVYIVLEATRLGVPKATIAKMGTNILTEVAAGTVPLVGDFMDVHWKANARNVALLDEHFAVLEPEEPANPWFVAAVVIGVLVVVTATAALSVWLIRRWLKS